MDDGCFICLQKRYDYLIYGQTDIQFKSIPSILKGEDVLGEVPNAPTDPSVGVVRVDDLDGKALITILILEGENYVDKNHIC